MKAITLHQPWATLIALGVKTIETRSWPTKHRGPIAIHAGKQSFNCVDNTRHPLEHMRGDYWTVGGVRWDHERLGDPTLLGIPRGAVVATANLVDCVPMVKDGSPWDDHERWLQVGAISDGTPVAPSLWERSGNGFGYVQQYVEAHYGHFEAGRWAWLLEDIEPLDEPVPATGYQGLWNWDDAS